MLRTELFLTTSFAFACGKVGSKRSLLSHDVAVEYIVHILCDSACAYSMWNWTSLIDQDQLWWKWWQPFLPVERTLRYQTGEQQKALTTAQGSWFAVHVVGQRTCYPPFRSSFIVSPAGFMSSQNAWANNSAKFPDIPRLWIAPCFGEPARFGSPTTVFRLWPGEVRLFRDGVNRKITIGHLYKIL